MELFLRPLLFDVTVFPTALFPVALVTALATMFRELASSYYS